MVPAKTGREILTDFPVHCLFLLILPNKESSAVTIIYNLGRVTTFLAGEEISEDL